MPLIQLLWFCLVTTLFDGVGSYTSTRSQGWTEVMTRQVCNDDLDRQCYAAGWGQAMNVGYAKMTCESSYNDDGDLEWACEVKCSAYCSSPPNSDDDADDAP